MFSKGPQRLKCFVLGKRSRSRIWLGLIELGVSPGGNPERQHQQYRSQEKSQYFYAAYSFKMLPAITKR